MYTIQTGMDPYSNTNSSEDAKDFEKGRIRALQEERLHIQKKTFTKWMNSFLQKARMEVEDLFTDLADGKKLLKLLEIISGEKLGKPNSGKMRVHRIENVNKSLAFLHTKVRLENIGAEDIVDGNPRMILGLIWTIILRFQIQEIEIDVDDNEGGSTEKKSAKEALLLWCQRKTHGYQHVDIRDFSSSWNNGLGFNALIHNHRPDLIDFNNLDKNDPLGNLRNAFDIADKHLGIPKLLDAEDIDTVKPDEKSVLTYVASYYHTFSKMKAGATGGKRIGNIVSKIRDVESQQEKFEVYSSDLLTWIKSKTVLMKTRQFSNTLEGIQIDFKKFTDYRMVEKPPKCKEKVEIEATYFSIQIKLQQLRQAPYVPPQGQRPHDIEQAWKELEREEYLKEVALREELLRQERLEQLAYKFERKSVLREGYLNEMIQVLSDPRYGSNLNQVGASVKKHEAISADILARQDRFMDLRNMSQQLQNENYHAKENIRKREAHIMEKWAELLELLNVHRTKLETYCSIINLQREMDTLGLTIQNLQVEFSNEEAGKHLLEVQDMLQKYQLQESQVNAMAETIKKAQKQAKPLLQSDMDPTQLKVIQQKLDDLEEQFRSLVAMSKKRQALLEDSHSFFQLIQDIEEEGLWLNEKMAVCVASVTAKDLRALSSLQQKHKALEDEMGRRYIKFQTGPQAVAAEMVAAKHPQADQLTERIKVIAGKWEALKLEAARRKHTLESSTDAYQFFSDCNETDSIMKESMTLAKSKDFGKDKFTAMALLQRHRQLHEKIQAIAVDVARVEEAGSKLMSSQISQETLYLTADPGKIEETEKLVPVEVWEDEPFERTEVTKVIEERRVPQVKAMFPYSGHGLEVVKGEVMFLLDKTNNDWWNIRRSNGASGFVPANYVKPVEPKIVSVEVKKPMVVKDVRKVKKTQYVKQKVQPANQKSGKEIINDRQNAIRENYALLKKLSKERQEILQNSLKLFDFYAECEDFNKWMKDKTKAISSEEEDVLKATKAFEKFLTDFSANKKRLEQIDGASKELQTIFPEFKKDIVAKQKETHKIYEVLLRVKEQQEKNLEGSASVAFFHKSCEDVTDWIAEKSEKLEMDDLVYDLTTVKALQRKHKGVERELAPIKDKVRQVSQLGKDVVVGFPQERDNIEDRLSDIQAKWEMLENKAKERSKRLEDAVGMQLFNNGVSSLLLWIDSTKSALNATETVRDVQTAEDLLNQHTEMMDEIRAKQDDFTQLETLGQKMYSRQPSQEIEEKVKLLGEERKAVLRGWQEKGDWLRQVRDLQLFNREADQIDASTNAHNKFLDTIDVGENWEDVEAFLKRHEDFSATLRGQEDRVIAFVEMGDRLVSAGHYSADTIDDRKNKVVDEREKLKAKAAEKREMLEASKVFQEFRTQVQEMKDFIGDKRRLVREDSFKGDQKANLKNKAKKHEVLEGEIKANAGQLKVLNRTGQQMVNRNHFKKDAIGEELMDVNSAWDDLVEVVKDQGSRLGQAEAQNDYNRMTNDIQGRLEDVGGVVGSKETGVDSRDCKRLLSQQAATEAELAAIEAKVNGLNSVASELAVDHFDGDNIIASCKGLGAAVEALKQPAAERKAALNQSMKFHDFNFDLNRELEWIAEKKTIASSSPEVQSLQQAQSADKKHKKLEEEVNGHSVVIEKVVESGQKLLDGPSFPASNEVVENTAGLKDAWQDLLGAISKKGAKLKLQFKAQQVFFEVGEVESWIGDQKEALNSTNYGKDEDSAVKLLKKHKALELEIDTYSGIIQEISATAVKLVNSGHPDSKVIKSRDEALSRELKALKNAAKSRRDKLVQSIQLHEYLRESSEFKLWIAQQMSTARSQDLGQDYEHLEVLLARFQDFKLKVQAGEEKFKTCDNLAKRLEAFDKDIAPNVDIPETQKALAEEWMELIQTIESRDKKLEAAGEIHRFNRDVAEAVSRIQEKAAVLESEDTGRDTKSVQRLIRKHEGFENDLVALEAQLQVLIDDSAALQAKYPGDNAEHIAEQQGVVLSSWANLQEKAAVRKTALLSSNDYHSFMGMVRDLVAWSSQLRSSLMTEEKVSDAASAQLLKTEHDNLKAEIETREKLFSEIVAIGEDMVRDNHYALDEVKEKIESVLTERQKLHTAWQHKKVYLDQLIDIHFYLRDVKQIMATSTAQEIALSNTECGNTIEEVEAHLKAHDAFQNLVAQQEEKVASLKVHADKLIRQSHFDSQTIQSKLAEVVEKRAAVAELCNHKTNLLNLNYLYAQFIQDASEEITWMDEKRRKLQSENKTFDDSNLTEKIKMLQRHQALQAEIASHKPQITEVCTKGNRLVQKRHESSPEIKNSLNALVKSWEELQHESELISKGLDEAKGILDFNNEVSKIETWIRDKELMVSQGDLGKDYEHCQELQKKLDDVDSDMRVDESRIAEIYQKADKLCAEAGPEAANVREKKDEIANKWTQLQGAIQTYREHLAAAGNIHDFQRRTDDTVGRIKEQLLVIDTKDKGKNLQDAEGMMKKVDGVNEFMVMIEKKIKDHNDLATELQNNYPDMTAPVREKMDGVMETCANANKVVGSRRAELESSLQYHKFVHDIRELHIWLTDLDKKIKADIVPNSASEADALMEAHQERMAELTGRQETFEKLKEFGEHLLAENHSESENIKEEMEKLAEMRKAVSQSWEETRVQLLQGHQLYLLKEQNTRTMSWLEEKEAFLNNDDLGDSLASVEALVRKHDGFVKTMEKQGICIEELENSGTKLIQDDHYESDKIKEIIETAKQRMIVTKDRCETRKEKLEDSRRLYQFLRKVYDIKSWLKEKTQVALDESYYDLSNMQNKIQKHVGFEAEIAANKPRLQAIRDEGEGLCDRNHFASSEIAVQLEDLQSEWNHLQETSNTKRARLQEANQALIFLHGLEEFDAWLEVIETVLQSEDHGKDLKSVSRLLKKLQATESEVQSRRENLKALEEQAEKFDSAKHFMSEELEQRLSAVQQRYDAVHEPMQIRRENLEDSYLLHQFNREVQDETIWLEEKLPLASSSHLGSSLSEVQNLQVKHQILESEIHSHDKVMKVLIQKADTMVRADHFASDDIKETMDNLEEGYSRLKDLSSLRKLRLNDAVESQQFYFELNEAIEWIKEKEPVISVRDFKGDEDSVQIYLKKVTDISADLETYQKKVEELNACSERMIERGHFDSNNIKTRIEELETFFENFKVATLEQKRRLVDEKAVIEFFHETEEVTEWINSQMAVAASEDYGKDVSHVEMLIQIFDSFMQTLSSSDDRIKRVSDLCNKLIEEENSHAEMIKRKMSEVYQLWEDLKELSAARHEALNGAKQVHVFDKNADETITWINEKEAEISADELGQDLETIQSLMERQEGFQRDLAAIQQQVAVVDKEAGVLCELFPDAAAHINAKNEETGNALTDLLAMSSQRDDKLRQNQQIQRYFDDYRELMAWASEVMAKITSPDLAADIAGAETLMSRHKEIRSEIDARLDSFRKFDAAGKDLVENGHFMSTEILEKISVLNSRKEKMLECWDLREEIYGQHIDYLLWAKEIDAIESWMSCREPTIKDTHFGINIEEVDELIRKHQDFEGAISAQESKLENINRITMIEQNFAALREREEAAKQEEIKRKEQERLETIKKKELARITNERRRENERRRTQEIKFNREDFDNMRAMASNGIKQDGSSSVSSTVEDMNSFSKRGESMRLEPKKHKRTPSFTTRRRTQSFRRHTKNLNTVQNLPPVEVDGFLDRKQELQSGGKKATIRSWKSYYTVLCGQLVCFYRDQEDFFESKAASPPVAIYQAMVEAAEDYTKRKYVFRVRLRDNSEFLFGAESTEQRDEWVKKIQFHATLAPAQQLQSYKSQDLVEDQQDEEEPSSPLQDTPPVYTSEPLYANLPHPPDLPPLPATQPPPISTGPPPISTPGPRPLSAQPPGSRQPVAGPAGGESGPLYANVGHVRHQDRANTLPVQQNRNSKSEVDSSDTISIKEKKGSVLGRFLGRKKVNS